MSVSVQMDLSCITSAFERLDTSIQDASTNKKLLTSRIDRLIDLKRQVELKEKAADEAKQEAATTSLDILAKVEALKHAQDRTKASNDMHAREVYAQRTVLAKDLKQLELRVSGVLNLGHTSLGVSDEMRRVLKMRLTKAVEEKELAYKERLEKERPAKDALAFEERQMLKLVEESKRLKQEAVKNSKLQDLFKGHESVVNILHEDVSDKHKDINLFIEHLDQPLLRLSGLLTSTQPSANLDLEVKSEPVVADNITKVRHSLSTAGRVVSVQTHADCVAAPSTVNRKDKGRKKNTKKKSKWKIFEGEIH